jgi:hypothetical protein
VHLDEIAPPLDLLALGEDVESREIGNGARRHVFAGNPFRVEEGHRARARGHRGRRVENLERRVGRVDVERHCHAGDGSGLCGRKEERDS